MGNGDFICLHLEVDTPGEAEDWALRVASDNPDTPTLITTHVFLRADGSIINVPYHGWGDPSWNGVSAQDLFDQVIAPDDIVLMFDFSSRLSW
jgi:hypothetical protein